VTAAEAGLARWASWPRWRRRLAEAGCVLAAAALASWALAADEAWIDRHFLPQFRLSRVWLVAGIEAARAAAAGLALVLALPIRRRLGRLAEQRSFRELALAAAPTAVGVVLAFGATELTLRVTGNFSHARELRLQEPLRRRDREIGWVVIPGRVGFDEIGGRRIAYAFDGQGLRVEAPGQTVDLRRPVVVFAGESVMMGKGLHGAETIPAQVQAMTGLTSANLAFSSYATDQAFMRLRRGLPAIERPVAVVTLVLPEGIYRMVESDRPHLDSRLRWRPAAGQWRLVQTLRQQFPYRSEADIDEAVAATRAVLRATADLARARGARSLVLVPIMQPESPQARALRSRVLDEAGIAYIAVPIAPDWRIPGNQHPDARAARAMAEAVAMALGGAPA
jgi:hypothetical protein